jgi:hypothetical protein
MFLVKDIIVSDEILDKEFVCNISACKGECCVAGEAGAPLEASETETLNEIYKQVKPYLRPEGIKAIEEQGTFINRSGNLETPLVDGKECAYTIFKDDGTALCGIEAAYRDGATTFLKPISCHLYPVRIANYIESSAVNYHKWDICDDACSLGQELSVPVYKFLKEALIRKFGQEWYSELEDIAENYR